MKENVLFPIGQFIAKLIMFSFYISLPKFIGLEEYGRFSYALAFCLICAQPIIDLGLDMIITKWVSRGAENIVRKAFVIRGYSSIVAIILVFILSPFFKIDLPLTLILVFYLIFISFCNIIFCFFRGKMNFIYEAFLSPGSKLLALIILLALSILFHQKSALAGGASLVCSTFLILIISVKIFKTHYHPQPITTPSYKELLKEAFTLFLTSILWMIYFRIDTLMLGLMVNIKEVGWYNTAYRLIEGTFVLPAIIMSIIYPKLAKQKNFLSIFFHTFFIMICLGILCMTIVYICASPVISILYGDKFKKSAELLKLLSFVVIPVFIGHLTTQSLIALDKSRLYLLFSFMATIANISLNWLFIPLWHSFGAAYATIITESLVTFLTGVWILTNYKNLSIKI